MKHKQQIFYRVIHKLDVDEKIILVYKLMLGGYCSAKDHTTTYRKEDLIFIDNNAD